MLKLVFSDMDGTLLDGEGKLPAEFDATMAELKKRGILFAPASGRQYYSLVKTFDKYKDDFVFLAENGTLVKYRGKTLTSSVIDRARGLEILAVTTKLPGVFSVYSGMEDGYILREQAKPEFLQELHKYYTHTKIVDSFEEVPDKLIKLAFFDSAQQAAVDIYPYVKQYESSMQVVVSSPCWVDIMNPDINKGVASERIQQIFGFKPEECAAFGDYMNDTELIESVYYGFAMENAQPPVKEAARFMTDSNTESGVIRGIERLLRGEIR